MSAFTKLRESDFSATEKRIADYILKNAHKLPEITISTVAKDCDTSKSMVVQLCKTAGFKGYKDLCSQLLVEQALSDQKGQEAMDYDEIHPGCTMAQICQITLREEMRSLLDSASLTPKSVALVFSFNGRTKDMIEACELSKEMGAKVISVTRFGNNPIAELSDVPLYVASNESLRRVTTMSSRLSTLVMVDVLFTCLANSMGDKVAPLIERNTMIANRRRK